MKTPQTLFVIFALFAVPLTLSLTSCVPVGYLATNTHLETDPHGAGVCIGAPFVPLEICLTAQPKDKSGDFGAREILTDFFSFFGSLGERQREGSQAIQALREANQTATTK